MKKVDIGLDIGIASVGWSITDTSDLSIVKHGVRLFPTVDDPKDSKLSNETRRDARSARRQKNRRKTLKRDFVKFLIDKKLIDDIQFDKGGKFVNQFLDKYINNGELQKKINNNGIVPFTFVLRKRALSEKLKMVELLPVLYWYINHRGFKYTMTDEKNEKTLEIDKNKLPIYNQLEYLEVHGYLNGELNRSFHQQDYLKEINLILETQNISSDIKDKFIELFTRQRSFEVGAGPSTMERAHAWIVGSGEVDKSKLRYSTWKYDEETKQISRDENMWEKTIGKCSVFSDEYRAPKNSFASSVFNLLSELNNISEKGEQGSKLSADQKIELLKIALSKNNSSISIANKICEFFNLDKGEYDGFSGYIKNTKDKPKFVHLEAFFYLKNHLPSEYREYDYLFKGGFNSDNIYDKISTIFSQSKVKEKRIENLKKLFNDESIVGADAVAIAGVKKPSFSDTHSFSYKAMYKMIPYLIEEEGANQYKWIHQMSEETGIALNTEKDYGTTFLKTDWIEDIIGTPTVKRAFRQTTKVLNAIFQYCKDHSLQIDDIVIEMTREKNNKAEKDNLTQSNKYFAQKNKEIEEFLNTTFSQKGTFTPSSKRVREKLWLLEQQKGHDAYTGEKIEIEELIKNPGAFDVDHVIPYSQSFSNNRSNKVLTRNSENIRKGNKTPFYHLKSKEFGSMKELWRDWYKGAENDRKVFKDTDKYDFLTSELDYSKAENQLGFIGRNLVDTSYTTRAILEALKGFASSDKNTYSFKVKTINGKMTSFARRNISFKSDNNGEVKEKLKRPIVNGTELPLMEEIDTKQKDSDGNPITRWIKSRTWNGHHAEDAYFVTVLNRHYKDSKAIEKVMTSPGIKFSRFKKERDNKLDSFAQRNFKELLSDFDIAREQLNTNIDNMAFSRMIEKKNNTKLFNETLYSGRMNEEGLIDKVAYKILLEIKKDSKLFGKNNVQKESLLIYRNNKTLYEALNNIFINYFDNQFPFKAAIEESSGTQKDLYWRQGINVNYKNNKGEEVISRVNKLRVVTQEGKKGKNPSRVIIAPDNKNSFYESMSWIQLHIYKNKKDKWKIITVDASNHLFKTNKRGKQLIIPKTEVLNLQKEQKNIDLSAVPSAVINKGDIIQLPTGEIHYVCGHVESADRLETKPLARGLTVEEFNSKKRWRLAINTKIFANSNLLKINIMGEVKKSKFIF